MTDETTANVDDNYNSDEHTFAVINSANTDALPTVTVRINSQPVKMVVDTGASVNIIDRDTHILLGQPSLSRDDVKLYTYGKQQEIPTLGKFWAYIEKGATTKHEATFYVVNKAQSGNLLTYATARKLDICNEINAIPSGATKQTRKLGKLKDFQAHLFIDDKMEGVVQTARRIPLQLRKPVEAEIQRLLDLDVIEPVNEPSNWVSPIVPVLKPNNEIRICVDMREANQAIQRQRHVMPTIDDIMFEMTGAKHFSKIDLRNAYHQLELDTESPAITTFATHVGLFRYKHLIYGVNSAAEIFQKTLGQLLQGLPGVMNVSDDIRVYGKSKEDHDRNLEAVVKRLEEKGLEINREKCLFEVTSLPFFGFVFGSEGVSADPAKVTAILDLEEPANPSELRSLLGMLNYSSRFIPDYATISHPLRMLTHKNAQWNWTNEDRVALEKLKHLITRRPVMQYFNPERITELVVDASPVGLGAILTQKDEENAAPKVIAYASRALTATEQKYSQIEREALAIIWACQHFHLYLLGLQFTVISDHKPLEKAFMTRTPSARIEKWALQLQTYCPRIVYRPGKENPADFLSRHPAQATSDVSTQAMEARIHLIAQASSPRAMDLAQIKTTTLTDPTMIKLTELIHNGKWYLANKKGHGVDNAFLSACSNVRTELTTTPERDVVLRGRRILLPSSLAKQAIQLAHVGHQGLVKTKQLLRTKVWFPHIDSLTDEYIQHCIACQAVTDTKRKEPPMMTELPPTCWDTIAIDFNPASVLGRFRRPNRCGPIA